MKSPGFAGAFCFIAHLKTVIPAHLKTVIPAKAGIQVRGNA
jgi:hypothetical protein